MPTMARRSFVLLASGGIVACAGGAQDLGPEHVAPSAASMATGAPSVASAEPAPSGALGGPLVGPPRIVVENPGTTAIDLYFGSIVDEEGKLGTMALWPDKRDCPDAAPQSRVLPARGVYDLAAPVSAYDLARCTSGPALPPGRYLVHLASGYGSELYAGGAIELPLGAPVRLRMEPHGDPPACTPVRARRAARLVLSALAEEKTDPALLTGCDPTAARCGALPLPDEVPPERCTITLHETLLRVRRPPGNDAPKEMTAWLDPEIVFAERAEVSRSSSAAARVGGARVVLEGVTQHHMHEHGGAAARVGSMRVKVWNGSTRKLPVRVLSVEWLSAHSCDKSPGPSGPPLGLEGFSPQELPPGGSELTIDFSERSAYQAWCDFFATRAKIEVGREVLVVTSEHEVTRIEPLRD